MEDDQAQAVPRLCRKGCGFFGSRNFDGFCSKCHRDMQAAAEKVQSVARLAAPIDINFSDDEAKTPSSEDEEKSHIKTDESIKSRLAASTLETEVLKKATDASGLSPRELDHMSITSPTVSAASSDSAPKKRLRCLTCNKRVGLTGFTCRCGGLFCTVHRYSDSHDCNFDYRESGQSDIRKANPQVVCSKINKI